ncbi:MAG: DUF1559 domain-containing protein, partial [Victivallales bacterium]|nr:DUF1559 domain-containing protein [Victivallales bacterium]
REMAKRSACTSNLRQIGLSISAYANDFNGYAPPAFGGGTDLSSVGNTFNTNLPWYYLVRDYSCHQVFWCPGVKPAKGPFGYNNYWKPGKWPANPVSGGCGVGYQIVLGQNPYPVGLYLSPARLDKIIATKQAIVSDTVWNISSTTGLSLLTNGGWAEQQGHRPWQVADGGNGLYADGRVKWFAERNWYTYWYQLKIPPQD